MEDFNKEYDIDLTTYFEKITCCKDDLNDIHNNPESGFRVRLERVKMVDMAESDKVVCKRTILCKHSADNANIVQESNECRFTWLQLFTGNETGDTINEKFVDEVLFYRKVQSFAYTAVNKCILHRDNDFIDLIEGYLAKVHASEDKLVEEVIEDQDTIENVESNVISIANSRKVVTRGRPKLASYDKNIATTTQEKDSKKHGQYTCGLCKQPGYNIATCPQKEK
ncbi:6357_t:CDS:2, partial [Dentiscutata erythropus]